VFWSVERRLPEPMLPLPLLRHRVRLGAYLIAGLLFACLYPSFFFLSRSLQDVTGQGPIEAGLRFLPIGLGVLTFAIVTRRLVHRVGARPLVIGGTAATALAALALTQLDADSSYPGLLLPSLIGLGAGVGTTFVANAAAAMTGVSEVDIGIGSGLLSTFQAVGGTVGVAALAAAAASVTAADPARALLPGFHLGFAIAAGLAGLACLVAVLTTPTNSTPKPTEVSTSKTERTRGLS
jgi:predicted MFS family arabinose efflux permease